MKKSIFALLFLLLLLIGTCVYQKTYALYALTTEEETSLPLEKKAEVISPKKEHLVAEKQNTVKTEKVVVSTIEEVSPKEPTLLEKIKTTVASVVSSEKEETPQAKVVSIKKVEDKTTVIATPIKQPTLNTKEEEKEVVDYLLTVLKERDVALANRDEAETRLQALIKQALENRRIAIENMDKASTEIETSHQKRLEERESKSQNNTEEKGK